MMNKTKITPEVHEEVRGINRYISILQTNRDKIKSEVDVLRNCIDEYNERISQQVLRISEITGGE